MTRRYTGHPAPRVQTARRVGTNAGGYTEGVDTVDGPRLFHGRAIGQRPPQELRAVPAPVPDQPAPVASQLLLVLEELAPSGVLPSLTDLGARFSRRYDSGRITEMLRLLAARKLIAWWFGREHECPGQHAIRIVATGEVLRTAECPRGVVP